MRLNSIPSVHALTCFLLGPRRCLIAAILLQLTQATHGEELRFPKVLDDQWQLQLVTLEPNLVTPVGCRFDAQGRLLVVSSHTHFPPDDYAGPKVDQIFRLDAFAASPDARSITARQQLFYEGGQATMGLCELEDDWIVVVTRSNIIKVRDRDGDGVAEEQTTLLRLDTTANYPHNGLSGVALGPDGKLYVGQGENLGDPYRLIGSDGSEQIGGGEGGNVFRCTLEGGQVERVATGFWNPFGLYFDPAGRLWCVDNDPDARPPCRLLHVVEGGDYGFQFRFGRAGTHPLQAWNGELPATLPMVSGTGEAPCAVVGYDNALWVTSWGSNRLERYTVAPAGASWSAKLDVIVQGEGSFRPVDMAVAPDGSLYFTDWVDRSYPVHGQGRLWRLSRLSHSESSENAARVNSPAEPLLTEAEPVPTEAEPGLTEAELLCHRLTTAADVEVAEYLKSFDSADPFVRAAAQQGVVRSGILSGLSWSSASTWQQRLGILAAWRWRELCDPGALTADQRQQWIQLGVQDAAPEVKLFAMRWGAERSEQSILPQLRQMLEAGSPQEVASAEPLSPRLFSGLIAAITFLETGGTAGGVRDEAQESLLQSTASNQGQTPALRSLALQMLPAAATQPTDEELVQWLSASDDRDFGGECVRLLAARGTAQSLKLLTQVAESEQVPVQVRADALAGLVHQAGEFSETINRLRRPGQPEVLREEAKRMTRGNTVRPTSNSLPQPHDTAGWEALVGDQGNVDAGRRVFFRTSCANCHAHSGRGSRIGPDLTSLAGQMSRGRLLESILQPSREIAPLFVPWKVLTVNGQVLTGIRLEKSGANHSMNFLGADGEEFEVLLADIEAVQPSDISIMPAGLEASLSTEEFADLLAFLLAE